MKAFNYRATVFANKQLCPALALNVSSISIDDKGLKLGCQALLKNWREKNGGETDVKAVYVDNPHRDGPGAERLFELAKRIPGEQLLASASHVSPLISFILHSACCVRGPTRSVLIFICLHDEKGKEINSCQICVASWDTVVKPKEYVGPRGVSLPRAQANLQV